MHGLLFIFYLLLYAIPEAITPIDTNGIAKISFVNHWGFMDLGLALSDTMEKWLF
jgi:hypothetical protein